MKNRFSFLTVPTGVLLFLLLASTASAKESPDFVYELALSFDISGKLLTGTARITVPPGENLTIRLDTISPTGILLQKGTAAPGTVTFAGVSSIRIPAEDMEQRIYISYEKHIQQQKDNFINERGISLLHSWYPFPSKKVRFSLSAALPPGFAAVSPSDTAPTTTDNITRFSFSTPLRSLQFVAAPFVVNSIEVRPGLTAYTYFFPEDQDLVPAYLRAAREYILRYEKLIGPYPYNHFAIVANSRPTGYGMPTFTLLGQNVLRLPFIKHTSLGHEILHSWFGNAVKIEPTSANWVEGLTTYLADWLYRDDIGEGAIVRKENSIKFQSYVTKDTAVPLQSFLSAGHDQPMAEALRSIGYSKGAMLFHELKILVGEETFYEAIRDFYSLYRNKEAGWEDIRKIFEEHSGISLASFFQERLTRTDIPDFTVKNISTTPAAGGFMLQFTVVQHTDEPFQVLLPVRVETSAGPQTFKLHITAIEEKVELLLDSAPFNLIVDPEYDLLRRLHSSERVPVWSLFQGPAGAKVVIPRAEKEVFASFLDTLSEKGRWQIEEEETFDINQASDTNLILIGEANRVSRSYFGGINHPPEGFSLEGRNHPLNTEKSILLVSGNDAAEVAKGAAKLRHYGKYNFLHFVNGMAVKKSFAPGNMGQHIQVAHKPAATPADAVLSLDTVINMLRDTQVIYIGETHTSEEDHHLQHLILESIFRRNPNIAIGLEMFPKSSQMTLDQYTLGTNPMEEKLFLKQSRYFEVWGYDYRYYKNIIDFAKKYHLPLVALNIDKAIVSAISQTGSADTLSEEQRRDLPQERDLSLPGYRERLTTIYNFHPQNRHDKGNVNTFIKAQAVWDEVMAENIVDFLRENPNTQLLVLAGAQHVRKDSGIPPRVQRRYAIDQKIILTRNHFSTSEETVADFFFSSETAPLPPAGRIGISLEEKTENDDTYMEITSLVKESKAFTSGLKVGDRLVSINGDNIETLSDIRIALFGAAPGEVVEIVVKRSADQDQTSRHQYRVELSPPLKPHR